jgi:hypothetical protein
MDESVSFGYVLESHCLRFRWLQKPVKFVSHTTEPTTNISNEFIYNNVLELKIKGFPVVLWKISAFPTKPNEP